MKIRSLRRFAMHCLQFAVQDAIGAAFGWATVVNASALVYVGHSLGITINADQSWKGILVYASSCFVAGLVIAFLINLLFVAPIKAYRLMRPLVLAIRDDVRSPDFAFNDKARGYNATVTIKNRSNRYLLDCTAHIMDLIYPDGSIFPRFVDKFDLPPHASKNLFIAYWFSREHPNCDDKQINLNGPVSAGFGGNRFVVPTNETVLKVKIQVSDVEAKHIGCRVWVDTNARTLRAVQTNV